MRVVDGSITFPCMTAALWFGSSPLVSKATAVRPTSISPWEERGTQKVRSTPKLRFRIHERSNWLSSSTGDKAKKTNLASTKTVILSDGVLKKG